MKRIFHIALGIAAVAFISLSAAAAPSGLEVASLEVTPQVVSPQDGDKASSKDPDSGRKYGFLSEEQMKEFRSRMKRYEEQIRSSQESLAESLKNWKDNFDSSFILDNERMERFREELSDLSKGLSELDLNVPEDWEGKITVPDWEDYEFVFPFDEDADESAAENAAADLVSKEYNLRNFTGVSASGIFKVELVSGPFSVKVECNDYLERYLVVKVSGGNLVLGLDNLPSSIQNKMRNGAVLRAYVSMPKIESVKLTGASEVVCGGEILSNGKFSCELSGATKMKGLSVTADNLDIMLSGASKCDIDASGKKANIILTGASVLTGGLDSESMEVELSGATKLTSKIQSEELHIQGSGSSLYDPTGSISKLVLHGTGASSFRLLNLSVGDGEFSLSGASNAKVDVKNGIKVDLTGASSLQYKDRPSVSVDVESVSRSATLKKL